MGAETIARKQKTPSKLRSKETWVWLLFFLILVVLATADYFLGIEDVLTHQKPSIARLYQEIVLAFMFLLFPVLFSLVFDDLPFTFALERRRAQNEGGIESIVQANDEKAPQTEDPRRLMESLAVSSSRLSERIFTRAGLYLLVGSMIAMFGITYVAFLNFTLLAQSDWREALVHLLPHATFIVVVETIAFFFFRLYRISMDEFKYYEAIKRVREENLIVLKMFKENNHFTETKDVLSSMQIYSKAGVLGKDETTEMIESRKILSQDFDLIEKMAKIISSIKK